MARILVVDDHVEIREALEALLEDEGHEVIQAENGRIALDQARLNQPDVILLDIAMPEIDGLETLRRLKADPDTARSSVIMVTAQGDRHAMVKAVQLGTRDYITKPWETGEVELCVNWALKAQSRTALRQTA